jgi:hypothetical protein
VREKWRDAADVVAARWEIFLHAEAEVRRCVCVLRRSTPKWPPQPSWLRSLREPPDSHDRLTSRTQGGVPAALCPHIPSDWLSRPWGLARDGCRPRVLRRYMLARRNRLCVPSASRAARVSVLLADACGPSVKVRARVLFPGRQLLQSRAPSLRGGLSNATARSLARRAFDDAC